MQSIGEQLGRGLDGVLSAMKWLVLPVSAMLFLQWPLRDVLQAYSREANDLGQILFALYAAASVAAASRAGTHLTAAGIAARYRPGTLRLIAIAGHLGTILPWVIFVAWTGRSMVLTSVTALERFQETNNPGYFLIKLSLCLLGALLTTASIADLMRAPAAGVADRPA